MIYFQFVQNLSFTSSASISTQHHIFFLSLSRFHTFFFPISNCLISFSLILYSFICINILSFFSSYTFFLLATFIYLSHLSSFSFHFYHSFLFKSDLFTLLSRLMLISFNSTTFTICADHCRLLFHLLFLRVIPIMHSYFLFSTIIIHNENFRFI